MKEELSLLLAVINLWWADYYMNDNFPDSAFIRFSREVNTGVLKNTEIRIKYIPQEDKWTFKPIHDE